ncbi:MAG: MarR family winged helix-turn-helix transcriptional regulator [Pseudonocardia sp.]|nr:MarR family winged helix-turn-helix transcriptional regulator [Pseudonocardia sp.]
MDGDDTGHAQAIEGYIDDGFLAWMATWKAQALVAREIEAAMRAHAGLSLTWGEVLSRLGAADGARMTMNELARQVFVSRSGISQVVTAMAKQGLVERQGDPENLRITYAVLTDHGRQTLKRSTTTFLGAIREHFGQHIDPDEARTVTEAMNRVTKTLGGDPDTPDTAATLDNLYRVVGAEKTPQEPDSTRQEPG